MPINGISTFRIDRWDEQTTQEFEGGAKLTRAVVTQTYEGDIEGTSTVDYLMAYGRHGAVRFVGLETLDGAVGGNRGTVVLHHVGQFVDGTAKSVWLFAEGTGTGALADLGGEGIYHSVDQQSCHVTFSYHLGNETT